MYQLPGYGPSAKWLVLRDNVCLGREETSVSVLALAFPIGSVKGTRETISFN